MNQRVKPFCLRRALRSAFVTVEACHVMLLSQWAREGQALGSWRKVGAGRTYVAIMRVTVGTVPDVCSDVFGDTTLTTVVKCMSDQLA